ncbi:MAG: efflux RND transporter periplasmic adaptor subunit [Planctomycetes bacterium]|nr:efflux RND transporter periplasmic adaptor subunit [Planctomycetota bacterium]MBL7038026.1 efflux RND transporter periplasmic adaptor subunit [Pirellulaceae bacterium]
MNDARTAPRRRWLSVLGSMIACLAILAASAAAIVVINRTEPTAQQISATRKSAALVETVTVQRGTYAPRLAVLGVVEAAQEVVLSPRVAGQVIELSPEFIPGGMVRRGDTLLRIDAVDFENTLSIREADLQQAEASLEIEEGRQDLARKELDLLGETIDETNRALALREPQLRSMQAEVRAAEAAVQRVKLDLERTSVFAPFDAQILSRSVNVGSQVATGDELGQLVGIDEYWIQTSVPLRSLRWIQFPEADVQGSEVVLRDSDTWGPDAQRRARVTRLIGALDRETRLARVLVTVPDPLGHKSDVPPLILGTLIEVEIEGRPIEDVLRLRREYVREGDTVWVMKEGKLEIRETDVVFRDAEHAYIRKGLESEEEVVISTLATVADGVGLRRVDDASEPRENSNSEATD